jgi:hypothetical protein
MAAIGSQSSHGGKPRVAHRPRRASRLVEGALAFVRDWRRRRQDRYRSSALEEWTLRDSRICDGDTFHLDDEQREREVWLDTLRFPPF